MADTRRSRSLSKCLKLNTVPTEYQTRSVFKWSKPGLLRNGSNLKWHSNPKVFVQISNGFGQNDYDRHSK